MKIQPITLPKAEFPYLVRQDDTPAESVITIRHTRRSEHGRDVLFYVVNAELRVDESREGFAFIEIGHSWARDEESDRAKVAYFELTSVEFVGSWNHHLNFRAWITKTPQFYPEQIKADAEQNPYLGKKERKGRDQYGYSKNTGFPYLPPTVTIPGFTTPIQVEFSVDYGGDSAHIEKWLKDSMRSHAKARREAEKKAREEKKRRDEDRRRTALRREAREAWLQTADGQEYSILHAEVRALPNYNARDVWTRTTDHGKRWSELHNLMELAADAAVA